MIIDRFYHGYSKKQLSKEVHEFLLAAHKESEKIQINQQIFEAYKNKWRRYTIVVNLENGRSCTYNIDDCQITGGSM